MDDLKAVIRDYVVNEYLEEGDDRTIEAETHSDRHPPPQ
jgi:hypothetical protein